MTGECFKVVRVTAPNPGVLKAACLSLLVEAPEPIGLGGTFQVKWKTQHVLGSHRLFQLRNSQQISDRDVLEAVDELRVVAQEDLLDLCQALVQLVLMALQLLFIDWLWEQHLKRGRPL